MLKRLIGISAALSLLVVAQTADAGGPRNPLQRVQQVARFAPDSPVRQTPRVQRTRPTTPTRPVVQRPTSQPNNPIKTPRIRPYVRCTDAAACGNGSARQTVRQSARQSTPSSVYTAEARQLM
ncbi:MAG: hypothetical protein ACOC1F_10200, partial [Myxococcota bacterium]